MNKRPEPRTIPDLFFNRVHASTGEEALLHKVEGRWRSITWHEYERRVRALARAILDWVQPKDIVGVLSENRPEWCFADLATLCVGGITAPIYPTSPTRDIAYILNDCKARLLFLSNQEQLAKVQQLRQEDRLPYLERVVIFDEVKEPLDFVINMSALIDQPEPVADHLEDRLAQIQPNDLATLLYTSGTTGEPKGVMLSHKNLLSNTLGAEVIIDHIDLPEKVMLSFLPLSHALERTAGYYVAIYFGFKVAFAESIAKLVDNMAEVKPTMLISVPRIYEKFYARVMESAQSGLKKHLIFWSLAVGKKQASYRLAGKAIPLLLQLKYALATKLVFAKLHQRLGGRLVCAISGGARLAPEIADFLNAIGLTVFEGYGLSESSPILTANCPGANKVGSVGKAWPDVEIRIVPDPIYDRGGEILARGPNVMLGYYQKPAATAEAIDTDGWLHTGDIGYLDDENFLYITDRKKELIKTSGGKYVAPQPIENILKVHSLIEEAVVVGEGRHFCAALIVPNFHLLQSLLARPLASDRSELNRDPQILRYFQEAVDKVNEALASWERIKRFYLLPVELSQDTGELTPSLKIKRRVVEEKFKTAIDSMYISP